MISVNSSLDTETPPAPTVSVFSVSQPASVLLVTYRLYRLWGRGGHWIFGIAIVIKYFFQILMLQLYTSVIMLRDEVMGR